MRRATALLLLLSACGNAKFAQADLNGPDLRATVDLQVVVDFAMSVDFTFPGDLSGFTSVEGCDPPQFVDETGANALRTVTPWDTTLGRKCFVIRKGQTVTWSPAPSADHPLEPTSGNTPSPVTDAPTATFNDLGVYGFDCGNHHQLMHGGIWVIE